ncbi:hypothetical protein BH11ACT8_BH11ACT8_15940 [soil metagenome]
MSETSRRNFMAVAGVGVAAASTVTLAASKAEAKPSTKRAKEPVMALVDDHKGSVVTLLVGDREVVVHDRDLVTRILNAAGGK